MAFRIQVRTVGITKAKLRAATAGKRVSDLRPVMKWAADRVEKDTKRRIAARGAHDGIGAWRPTTTPNPPLIKTGRLLRSTQKGGRGHLRRVDKRSAKVGVRESHVPYYKYHQDGAPGVPQRVFLHWGPASDRLFHSKLKDYITKQGGRL